MAKSRRANAVVFGFDFQVNAAIVLMIENIEDLKSLRLEGNYEDIEIELENNQYILAQAKAVERSSSDFRNVRKNLEKSPISLSEGNQKVDAQRLILITNSPNPLNEEASRSIFWGDAHREFLSLPESSQELIRRYLDNINQPLDTDKFMIQILPFETDNDIERYKVVKRVVDDFIGDLNLNIPGLGKKLLSIWHEEVFENGTKKDAAIQLKKKDLIWPIMVVATDVGYCDNSFADIFDSSAYDEIVRQYRETIESCCERCEFFIKVLCDYNTYQTTKKPSEKCLDFVMNKWRDYLLEFELDGMDEEIQKGLIQIILYRIVRNRIVIHKKLFAGIYGHAGKLRDYNITKKEWVLNGATVLYGSASELRATLDYDFAEEKKFSYKNLSMEEIIHHLAFFVSRLWQIHVFGEGNTRTTAVFFIKYLRTLGFDATNDIFAENAWYFRNALVRANYNDLKNGVHETTEYLELFLRNLLLDEKNELHNRTMHISGRFAEVDIERVKVDIKSREVDIESTKVDIRNKLLSFSDTISEKTINHTVEIFSKCGKENCFGRTIVEEITGLKPSRASKLIKLLVDSEVIVPVTGHGKGKYRFQ